MKSEHDLHQEDDGSLEEVLGEEVLPKDIEESYYEGTFFVEGFPVKIRYKSASKI